jgi:hypothetical protein
VEHSLLGTLEEYEALAAKPPSPQHNKFINVSYNGLPLPLSVCTSHVSRCTEDNRRAGGGCLAILVVSADLTWPQTKQQRAMANWQHHSRVWQAQQSHILEVLVGEHFR